MSTPIPLPSTNLSAFSDEISRSKVAYTSSVRCPMPVPLFDGQQTDAFARGLELYNVVFSTDRRSIWLPAMTLSMFTIENATVLMGTAVGGMVLDSQNRRIVEPSCFCTYDLARMEASLSGLEVEEELDEAFVGFDAPYANYYHWLLYGLSRTKIACERLPPSVKLIIPDVPRLLDREQFAYSPETFEETLRGYDFGNRLVRMGPGAIRIKKLHFMWHEPTMPELYLTIYEAYRTFDDIEAPFRPDLPRRFYVTREKSVNARISPDEQHAIDQLLAATGIEKIFLEHLDFRSQVALFRQAELIVAPHGAGLANLVFARPGTKVLELNRLLDGQNHLRNCFYLIAAQRKLIYGSFDLSHDDLTAERLMHAIRNLEQNSRI
ncbi:glycosyltransferase family 61 protein [Acetobacter conturbans]|nr:glycosyltransferase family 61 protein [Acetobacter conturbans]